MVTSDMLKQIQLSPEEAQRITQIEASIQHWAIEYAQITLKVRDLEDMIRSLYSARKQNFDTICGKANIDIKNILQANLNRKPDNSLVLTVQVQPQSEASNPEIPPEIPASS
jgi:hypothetical protein